MQVDLFFYRDPEETKEQGEEEAPVTAPDYGAATEYTAMIPSDQWPTDQWAADGAAVPPAAAAVPPAPAAAVEWAATQGKSKNHRSFSRSIESLELYRKLGRFSITNQINLTLLFKTDNLHYLLFAGVVSDGWDVVAPPSNVVPAATAGWESAQAPAPAPTGWE